MTTCKLTVMTLGQRIRELRDQRDLSLRELASRIGCSAPFLSDIELGRRYPSEKVLKDIADQLGEKIEELKAFDTRPPVEAMKQRIAADPRYAYAFRTVIEKNISPDDLLDLANRQDKKKK
ncbi:helix-turn-helix domain-containing protein [Verrucomicrobium sp. 3C]|uniref:helix-turn-helix domain-containing protein n=1 Tax=Verrucomicrobium sp. 3C TaxID=1134055 RepID=UPI0009D95A50|nr:helix-turn-helix transcriptional regulator [Verrucomicrobium sp. 3C]